MCLCHRGYKRNDCNNTGCPDKPDQLSNGHRRSPFAIALLDNTAVLVKVPHRGMRRGGERSSSFGQCATWGTDLACGDLCTRTKFSWNGAPLPSHRVLLALEWRNALPRAGLRSRSSALQRTRGSRSLCAQPGWETEDAGRDWRLWACCSGMERQTILLCWRGSNSTNLCKYAVLSFAAGPHGVVGLPRSSDCA